jgi:hypothetical protein
MISPSSIFAILNLSSPLPFCFLISFASLVLWATILQAFPMSFEFVINLKTVIEVRYAEALARLGQSRSITNSAMARVAICDFGFPILD